MPPKNAREPAWVHRERKKRSVARDVLRLASDSAKLVSSQLNLATSAQPSEQAGGSLGSLARKERVLPNRDDNMKDEFAMHLRNRGARAHARSVGVLLKSMQLLESHKGSTVPPQLYAFVLMQRDYAAGLQELFQNTVLQPTDFDTRIITILDDLDSKKQARDACRYLLEAIAKLPRGHAKNWRAYIKVLLNKFRSKSLLAVDDTKDSEVNTSFDDELDHPDLTMGSLDVDEQSNDEVDDSDLVMNVPSSLELKESLERLEEHEKRGEMAANIDQHSSTRHDQLGIDFPNRSADLAHTKVQNAGKEFVGNIRTATTGGMPIRPRQCKSAAHHTEQQHRSTARHAPIVAKLGETIAEKQARAFERLFQKLKEEEAEEEVAASVQDFCSSQVSLHAAEHDHVVLADPAHGAGVSSRQEAGDSLSGQLQCRRESFGERRPVGVGPVPARGDAWEAGDTLIEGSSQGEWSSEGWEAYHPSYCWEFFVDSTDRQSRMPVQSSENGGLQKQVERRLHGGSQPHSEAVAYQLKSLLGFWRDSNGSSYAVSIDEHGVLDVSTTRPSGQVVETSGLITLECKSGWIVWGRNGARSQYWLSQLWHSWLRWEREGSKSFDWFRC